jgi:arsenite-transporting ATPase
VTTFLNYPTRFLFFTGKGGVGKTSLACATALWLADAGQRVLLVSTDPASNLDQVLETEIGTGPTPIPSAPNLVALNIDPEEAAAAYRRRALEPLRIQFPEADLRRREEELSGACTLEIATFDEFTRLLTDQHDLQAYDHVLFDTAPTGHTLRLLSLPGAWSDFLRDTPDGASCLGPHSGLQQQRRIYEQAVATLRDPTQTTMNLVARPELSSLDEAARAAKELHELGIEAQQLVINGVFSPADRLDPIAVALERREQAALSTLPEAIANLPRQIIPLHPFNLVGLSNLRQYFRASRVEPPAHPQQAMLPPIPSLDDLVSDLERDGRGLILVMGKGGVGKTTIATLIARQLAQRGHAVHLTTTDPANRGWDAEGLPWGNLRFSRIDPATETRLYTERVLSTRGRHLSPDELALLQEDLRSPCTEEVAVFHAFSRVISQARSAFVIVDTAPTGHKLLLLDATGAYHHEVMRSLTGQVGVRGTVTPLMRLRDPAYTKMVIVTLPETTPVLEAAQLQTDLRRAGIEPYAWIINKSLAGADVRDPLLQHRAIAEREHIQTVQQSLAKRAYLVPWLPDLDDDALAFSVRAGDVASRPHERCSP